MTSRNTSLGQGFKLQIYLLVVVLSVYLLVGGSDSVHFFFSFGSGVAVQGFSLRVPSTYIVVYRPIQPGTLWVKKPSKEALKAQENTKP